MYKRIIYFIVLLLFVSYAIPNVPKGEAATLTATFDKFTYTETTLADGTVKKTPTKVTLKNAYGKTLTYKVSRSVKLLINNTETTMDGFKKGMKTTFQISSQTVTAMNGSSGTVSTNAKRVVTGYVTSIDPNGMYILVKPDVGKEVTYYINQNTTYKKGNEIFDISSMYVGDRVKLTFNGTASLTISEISIINDGVLIENLYKGTLQKVNAISNALTVRNEQPFTNWSFATSFSSNLSTVNFQNTTPIYYGNKKIGKEQLNQFAGSEVYYVTIKQFGKEIVKKIVVLANNERTYFENMLAVDTAYKFMNLQSAGRMYFHNGSILIRNGRLVEPTALRAAGTAFVVADGVSKNNYAQVVQISNDSFTSPNLASHSLYFGKLSLVDGYLLELKNAVKLENNYWKTASDKVLSFSNSTVAVSNEPSGMVNLSPADELLIYEGAYGYFYVKDDYVSAIHLLDDSQPMGEEIFTGSLTAVDTVFPKYISARNVNIWHNGNWLQTGDILNMNIDQATIIRNGKVIDPTQLNKTDRVVIFSNSTMNSYVILAD